MALHLRDVKKQYRSPDGSVVPVIDVPNLRLENGEQVALMGTSGSGKTTLLHLIAGILAPDSGQILYDDLAVAPEGKPLDYQSKGQASVDISQLSEAQRDVFRGRNLGYIFQTHHLLPGFTALENVLLGMSFGGKASDPAWAKHLLEEVGLAERLHYRPAKLSIGQQQRVAVARALANRPRLVLADEPTGALDSANAQQVLQLIRKLCTEVGATLLLVTHDADIAGQLQRSLVLSEVNIAGQKAARP